MRGSSRRCDARWVSCCMAFGAILVGCIAVGPTAEIEPTSLEFSAVLGGENPPPQHIYVADPLTSTPPYEVSTSAHWLTAEPMPWNPLMGRPFFPGERLVSVTLDGLPVGEHHAEIEFTDADGFLVATVPVTITVILDDCVVLPELIPDTFDAVGIVTEVPEKWAAWQGGRYTHVLEAAEGTKLLLCAGTPEAAGALAASEGRRAWVSGDLFRTSAMLDSNGPVPPEGEVTDVRSLAISTEAYGIPVPAASIAGLCEAPEEATHAFTESWYSPGLILPPGPQRCPPIHSFRVRRWLAPTEIVPDLAPFEGKTIQVEGEFVGVPTGTVGIIRVSVAEEVAEAQSDRILCAAGQVVLTTASYPPAGATHELRRPKADAPGENETLLYLSGGSPVDLAGLEGSWVEVSGVLAEGSHLGGWCVLSVEAATQLPAEFDYQDHARLQGRIAEKYTPSPSAATHSLCVDAGPLLPAFTITAYLRSEQAGLLEQWKNCGTLFVEGSVDSWITWEGDQSFATLVNVTGVVSPFEGVWLVDDDALPGGNGRSWATAFQHPQDAVDAASAGEEVWVAEGTYTRRDSADTVLLTMQDGVALYGGFAGTETSGEARDWTTHETILDGENAVDHVVAGASHSRLDGFTVTGGSANEGVRPDYNGGGGMRNESVVNLTVADCTFAGNSGLLGGGMYNESSSLAVTGCVFSGNSAAIHGGGMDNYYCSSLEIVNCTFTGNSAFWDGGGMRSYDSCLTVTNCSFTDNSAGSGGGMVNCGGSSADVTNCILWGNVAPNGPEVYNDAFTSVSCVLTYNCIGQAGYTDNPDDHNINADPLFMDPANGDLRLSASSPCIDAGTADGAPDHDLDGYPRPSGWGVDMGAYEYRNGYDETFTITSDVPLSATFETVEQGAWADPGCHPKGAYFFSTASEFASFYSTLRGNMLPPPTPPAVDFAQYGVVAVVDNGHVSTGYSVEITSIELDSGNQYNVTARFTEPTGLVGAAITQPYHIVKVAFSSGCGGSVIPTTSGRDSMPLNAYGCIVDVGASFHEFDFGTGEIVTGTRGAPAGGDVAFLLEGYAVQYCLTTRADGGIIDMGTADLALITQAPEAGYSGSVVLGGAELDSDWSPLIGRSFCVRTVDGTHYAKMKIVDADSSGSTVTLDWVYLPDGGRVFSQ